MKHQENHVSAKYSSNAGSNAWMFVSILLGVLLVVSFITNIYVISKVTSLGSQAQIAVPSVPSAAVPQAQQPSAPAARVQVSIEGRPVLGKSTAPVTIVEFSDFQCPYCQRWYTDTYAKLKTDYIDTGKVKFVFRNFPLSFHQNAEIAAEGAECANEQGKYWEFHDILFTKGSGDGTGLDAVSLKKYAADLKLDTTKFNSCLDTSKYKVSIQKDQTDGTAAGVSGTPSFVINGLLVVGAQPYSVFQQAIDAELAK